MIDDVAKKIYDRYHNDVAGWACQLTDIFRDKVTQEEQLPYPLQVKFMNGSRDPKERVIVILKSRQCKAADTLVHTESGKNTIRELCVNKYKGKVWTFNQYGKKELDQVIDVWFSGKKELYEISLWDGKTIKLTAGDEIRTAHGWRKVEELKENDPVWILYSDTSRASHINGIKSITKLKGLHPTYDLETQDHQSFIANGIHVHNCGFTTAIKAKVMHAAYFGLLPNIIIASAGEKQANKVLAEIKDHYRSMGPLCPGFVVDNASELVLDSGAKITSVPANPNTVRGNSAEVFWDEAGVFSRRESDEFWSAIFPSISKGWKIYLISTPKGKDNVFYDLCNPKRGADGEILKKGIRANKIIKVDWTVVPHIKAFVEDAEIEDYTDKLFLQEYCCEFLDDAEDPFFSSASLDAKMFKTDLSFISDNAIFNLEDDDCPQELRLNLTEKFKKIYLGYDPAISESKDADGAAIEIVGIDNDDVWTRIFSKVMAKGFTQKEQCKYVSRLALYVGANKVGFDVTGGMGLTFKERLEETKIKDKLVPVLFESNMKVREASAIKNKIETGKLISPEDAEMRKQMLNLTFNPVTKQLKAAGSWRKNKDDKFFALVCAHFCENKKKRAGFSIVRTNT
jgi:phage FluMu gp28-like protein